MAKNTPARSRPGISPMREAGCLRKRGVKKFNSSSGKRDLYLTRWLRSWGRWRGRWRVRQGALR